MKRNGFVAAFRTAKERLVNEPYRDYTYTPCSYDTQNQQRNAQFGRFYKFSIVVPCYETDRVYLSEMIESVLNQTYEEWELILADASKTEKVRETVEQYKDPRIIYVKLPRNLGISGNTNAAIQKSNGDYTVLLDHDDLLTQDALYEMQAAIEAYSEQPVFLYSDEDKTDETKERFFEPHIKLDFNYDLLLSNNYICHLMVIRTSILKKIKFRNAYDGAQDFDLTLRLTAYIQDHMKCSIRDMNKWICHVPKVLYHWRCHAQSTAANPESKHYAYDAGLHAVQDFIQSRGWKAVAEHDKHLGYYHIEHALPLLFMERPEIGAVGGPIFKHGKIAGGAMSITGRVLWQGVNKNFSGYMNRISTIQDVPALDIRNLMIREELAEEFLETPQISDIRGIQNMHEINNADIFIYDTKYKGIVSFHVEKHQNPIILSVMLSEFLRQKGFLLYYNPGLSRNVNQ